MHIVTHIIKMLDMSVNFELSTNFMEQRKVHNLNCAQYQMGITVRNLFYAPSESLLTHLIKHPVLLKFIELFTIVHNYWITCA